MLAGLPRVAFRMAPQPRAIQARNIAVGTDLKASGVTLQKARTWDEGVADGFKATDMSSLLAEKKVILFALPGAHTGVCENAHVPSYVSNADAFKAKGVDTIACVSVNDPYTMNAWGKALDPTGKIEFYGDSDATFTEAMGKALDLNVAALGPGKRSHRYSMLLEDGVVAKVFEEEAPSDAKVSDGATMLDAL